MARLRAEAVIEAIRRLAATDLTSRASSALEAYLVAKRMEVQGRQHTIRDVNEVVAELFVLFPEHPRGRVFPFVAARRTDEDAAPKWGDPQDSGRKTVWNVTSRGRLTDAASLFNNGDIREGLRPDAASVLSVLLTRRGREPIRPNQEALMAFLLRDAVFDEKIAPDVLGVKLEKTFGIGPADLAHISAPGFMGIELTGEPAWATDRLTDELKPPDGRVAAARGTIAAVVPTRLFVDERIRRMVRLSILSTSAVILVGPPGTGKTRLIEETVDEILSSPDAYGFEAEKNPPIWATPDESWTTLELVGGQTVDERGKLRFRQGLILQAIEEDRWLILDEANRADMDKIFGGVLTWLSDRSVQIGRVSTHASSTVVELGWAPEASSRTERLDRLAIDDPPSREPVRFLAGTEWRLLGTYNALDAQRVFRFGQALGRRFARVPIPVPSEEDFDKAMKAQTKGLPDVVHASILALFAAHRSAAETLLGPALFLRMPAYIRAGLENEPEDSNDNRTSALIAEAYLINVGTWLSRLTEAELFELGRCAVEERGALDPDQWSWIIKMLPSLG